ncbi:MAG: hypothetical protein HY754_15805 [Nitrospirae bacterium]|nr:hypothetical protein [Nitrospirota bacterium]
MTVAELKQELKAYNYETLTGGDDSVAERCLQKAELWVRAKVRKCGVEPDLNDEIVKEALKKRFLYELYSYAENEDIAKDKKHDAIDILRSYYGNCVDKDSATGQQGGSATVKGDPVVHVKPGSDGWKGFK